MRKGRLGLDRAHPVIVGATLGAALVALMAGGVGAQGPAVSTPPPHRLDSTNWALASITMDGTPTPVASDPAVTLEFVGDRAGGSVGCDRDLAPFAAEGAALTFGDIETTRTPCDETSSALTTAYLAALSSAVSFSEADGTLSLLDTAGAPLLGFGPAPMPSVDGSWTVTGFSDGSSMVTPSPDTAPALAFKPGGTLEGTGGCHRFGGPFGVSESDIAIGPLMSTIRRCDDTLDAQETRLLESLQQAYTWAITSGDLELRSYEGLPVVTARAGSADASGSGG
jgi:heat shock protein HslJ